MNERRPPTKPGRPGARISRHGHETGDRGERTDVTPQVAPMPAPHSRRGFDDGPETTSAVLQVVSADISLIDAEDLGPAPSDSGFAAPPRASVFLPPPAGIAGAGFNDERATADETLAGTDLSTDSMKSSERPIEVRKWRIGGEEPSVASQLPESAPGPQRIRTSVVPLPPTDHGEPMGGAAPRASSGVRRAAPALDVAELRRVLEDAEELLSALEVQLSSREGQGAKAQLRAALHRLSEARSMLPRS